MSDTDLDQPDGAPDTLTIGMDFGGPPKDAPPPPTTPYRVLARKYRPERLSDLVGQEVLTRTLTSAFQSGRLAHAWLLTGVRGIGKTTTARIIARGLNCIGADGAGGPTPEPCGACANCRQIAEGRHLDVSELDAASNNSVENAREIIERTRSAPAVARYKVFILDEVHMLSNAAFNALLKTLEEPPGHTKFILATTELRKLPPTVVSRCQRFDLKRLDQDTMAGHLARIAGCEKIALDEGASRLLARAADGSVRDGLSLLDRAIAMTETAGIDEALVQRMLGLADRFRVFDLFQALMAGDLDQALGQAGEMAMAGAEPLVVAQDLLSVCHAVTRARVTRGREAKDVESQRLARIAAELTVPVLTRAWQMLLKVTLEVAQAPDGRAALEMGLIRLAHQARQPDPGDLMRRLAEGEPSAAPSGSGSPSTGRGGPVARAAGGGLSALAARPATAFAEPADFEAVVALCGDRGEQLLRGKLTTAVAPVAFEQGRISLRPVRSDMGDLPRELSRRLAEWTGRPWLITLVNEGGGATLHERARDAEQARLTEAAAHPVVRAVLERFPGAKVRKVRPIQADAPTGPAADPAVGESDLEVWDDGDGFDFEPE